MKAEKKKQIIFSSSKKIKTFLCGGKKDMIFSDYQKEKMRFLLILMGNKKIYDFFCTMAGRKNIIYFNHKKKVANSVFQWCKALLLFRSWFRRCHQTYWIHFENRLIMNPFETNLHSDTVSISVQKQKWQERKTKK